MHEQTTLYLQLFLYENRSMPKKDDLAACITRFWGEVKSNTAFKLGVIGVLLALLGGAGFQIMSAPLLGSRDAPLHMDYAWQVYNGDLPSNPAGPELQVEKSLPPIQFTAHHPPLYYAILAPFIGPFIEEGNWRLATFMGRFVTLGISLLTAVALMWGAWLIAEKRKLLYAIAVPAMVTSFTMYAQISGAIYSDIAVVLTSTLGLALVAAAVRYGITRWTLIAFAVVATLGMLSRVSFISVFGIMVLSVYIATFLHLDTSWKHKIKQATLYALAVITPAVIASGWFYWHNYQISGSPIKSGLPGTAKEFLNRPYKSFRDVVTGKLLYTTLPYNLFGRSMKGLLGSPINIIASKVVLFVTFGLAFAWAIKNRFSNINNKTGFFIAALLGLQVVLIFGQQLFHAVGYGAFLVRYFLPMWLPLGMIMATGALAIRKLRGFGVLAIVVTGWGFLISKKINVLFEKRNFSMHNPIEWADSYTSYPEIYIGIMALSLFSLTVGIMMQGVSLWRLTGETSE